MNIIESAQKQIGVDQDRAIIIESNNMAESEAERIDKILGKAAKTKKEVPARHEHKLIINMSDYLTITSRLKHVAYLDRNSLDTGGYQIRSMYFDDYSARARNMIRSWVLN